MTYQADNSATATPSPPGRGTTDADDDQSTPAEAPARKRPTPPEAQDTEQDHGDEQGQGDDEEPGPAAPLMMHAIALGGLLVVAAAVTAFAVLGPLWGTVAAAAVLAIPAVGWAVRRRLQARAATNGRPGAGSPLGRGLGRGRGRSGAGARSTAGGRDGKPRGGRLARMLGQTRAGRAVRAAGERLARTKAGRAVAKARERAKAARTAKATQARGKAAHKPAAATNRSSGATGGRKARKGLLGALGLGKDRARGGSTRTGRGRGKNGTGPNTSNTSKGGGKSKKRRWWRLPRWPRGTKRPKTTKPSTTSKDTPPKPKPPDPPPKPASTTPPEKTDRGAAPSNAEPGRRTPPPTTTTATRAHAGTSGPRNTARNNMWLDGVVETHSHFAGAAEALTDHGDFEQFIGELADELEGRTQAYNHMAQALSENPNLRVDAEAYFRDVAVAHQAIQEHVKDYVTAVEMENETLITNMRSGSDWYDAGRYINR